VLLAFDENGDGVVDYAELKAGLAAIGTAPLARRPPPPAAAPQLQPPPGPPVVPAPDIRQLVEAELGRRRGAFEAERRLLEQAKATAAEAEDYEAATQLRDRIVLLTREIDALAAPTAEAGAGAAAEPMADTAPWPEHAGKALASPPGARRAAAESVTPAVAEHLRVTEHGHVMSAEGHGELQKKEEEKRRARARLEQLQAEAREHAAQLQAAFDGRRTAKAKAAEAEAKAKEKGAEASAKA
jgi:hypothetical protein